MRRALARGSFKASFASRSGDRPAKTAPIAGWNRAPQTSSGT